MLYLILLAFGVAYMFRRPKLAMVTPNDFPNVAEEAVWDWRRLEIASIDVFLAATWGVGILGFGLGLFLPRNAGNLGVAVHVSLVVLFLVGVVISAAIGSQAATIKRNNGIQWPRPA